MQVVFWSSDWPIITSKQPCLEDGLVTVKLRTPEKLLYYPKIYCLPRPFVRKLRITTATIVPEIIRKILTAKKIAVIILKFEKCKYTDRMVNRVYPDQTAPSAAVSFGSTLFAQTCLSVNFRSLRYYKITMLCVKNGCGGGWCGEGNGYKES